MGEDDHAKYRPDDENGATEEGDAAGERSSRDSEHEKKYVHAPAVDISEFESDESSEADAGADELRDAEAERSEGSSPPTEDESDDTDDTSGETDDVEWSGAVGHAAGVETPVPRNLVATIVAVFLVLGSGMALLGLLFAGIDLVVLDSFQRQVSLLSPSVLVAAIPAQAGVVAVLAGFYAGTRDEDVEAIVAAASGTVLGTALQIVLVSTFVSMSANMVLRVENLILSAVFLGLGMGAVTAGCAIVYDRYVTHPDGFLGSVSDRLAPEERRGASSRARK
jgi:hypothetical protein